MSFKTENTGIYIRLAQQHAGIVDQVACGEIVGAVGDDIELLNDVQSVRRFQARLEAHHIDFGIHVRDASSRRLQLGLADVFGAVSDLALQVSDVYNVKVH